MNVSKEVAVFPAKPEDFALARAALQLILQHARDTGWKSPTVSSQFRTVAASSRHPRRLRLSVPLSLGEARFRN